MVFGKKRESRKKASETRFRRTSHQKPMILESLGAPPSPRRVPKGPRFWRSFLHMVQRKPSILIKNMVFPRTIVKKSSLELFLVDLVLKAKTTIFDETSTPNGQQKGSKRRVPKSTVFLKSMFFPEASVPNLVFHAFFCYFFKLLLASAAAAKLTKNIGR